jgi:hypothetical protein
MNLVPAIKWGIINNDNKRHKIYFLLNYNRMIKSPMVRLAEKVEGMGKGK